MWLEMLWWMFWNGDLFLWVAGLGFPSAISWLVEKFRPSYSIGRISIISGLIYGIPPLALWLFGLVTLKPTCVPNVPCRADGMQMIWIVVFPIFSVVGFAYASLATALTTWTIRRKRISR